MTNRREFLLSGAAALAASPTTANVVVFMSDEHNPLYSQVYGHPFVEMPNLQRLARMGTVFSNAYCPSPLCMPSRSAFLTGRRVFDIQTYGNCNVFLNDYPTYGGVLKAQGVHTVHIGKTDVFNKGATLGFSEMIRPADRAQPGDTVISRNPLAVQTDAEGRSGGYGVKAEPAPIDTKNVDSAIQWLTDTAPTLQQPWTLAINVIKPHFPHFTTQQLWDKYAAHADLPKYGKEAPAANHPYAQDLRKFFGTDVFNEQQTRNLRRGYYGCVSWMDQQLGRVMDALEQSNRLKDTVLAYTTDHGEMLGKFGMWWKRSLYEDSVRIPMIVAGPGFKAGQRVSTPVDSHDLQASIFHATGKQRPKEWVGQALQTIPANDSKRVVFAEFQGGGTRASAFLIRKGRWKMLYNCAAPHQLFDLESDPDEMKDLATKEPAVLRQMQQELRRICDPDKENRRAEDYTQRQLQALGRKAEA